MHKVVPPKKEDHSKYERTGYENKADVDFVY